MSRRTQRTTKYIFATLAQLSENFIFIYLGLSLFTSPPSSTKVTNYFKPLFVVVTTVAVIFTRYAAVFPLSELINLFHRHVRGQVAEELPHSYQMMLFWAGLRGAVGVALAAGFKGENAQTLRITVLVVVVLTVVVFGGTTARMLEVLGIRTGVEDEGASSDDEDEVQPRTPWLRRGGRWGAYEEEEEGYMASQQAAAYGRLNHATPPRVGMHYETTPTSYNHHTSSVLNNNTIFSAASSDSYDSDGEVLPMVSTSGDVSSPGLGGKRISRDSGALHSPTGAGAAAPVAPIVGGAGPVPGPGGATSEEGKWFQALDERYLLPLFSNATASRTFHARKARRASGHAGVGLGFAGGSGSRTGTPADSDEEPDDEGAELDLRTASPLMTAGASASTARPDEAVRAERGLASPMLRRDSEGNSSSSKDRAGS